jgi:purine catabolism regulator
VLAVASDGAQDRAGREVVTSVIALASLALQQNRELDRARSLLRTGLLTLLTLGNTELADAASRQLWGPLPPAPIRVAAIGVTPADIEEISGRLERAARSRKVEVFFAYDDHLIVCVAAAHTELVRRFAADHELHTGLSDPTDWTEFAAARGQAQLALARAAEGPPRVTDFDDLARSGVLAFLARAGATEIARAALAPLRDHDATHGTALLASVRCWLEHDCEYDRAARGLGVHRHTMRARMDLAASVLGLDLSRLSVRADLWAAYLAAA